MNRNENLRVSLIVAVYKDIEALDLIIQSLKMQTYKNFEVVIVEDNDAKEMKDYIANIKDLDIKHTYQSDIGIRKTRSLNNGILAAEGEYLIFIDGDCIPYSTFIEAHVQLSDDESIITGRRVNLGPKYSGYLRSKIISPFQLERTFLYRLPLIAIDAVERHAEEGIYFKPDGFLFNKFIKNRTKNISILGCNYSCYKKYMLEINGYDEGYALSSLGDDTDLEWRFRGIGLKLKSARGAANMFHLYHKRGFRESKNFKGEIEKMKSNQKNQFFTCKEGLNTH